MAKAKDSTPKSDEQKRQKRNLLKVRLQSWLTRSAAWFASRTIRVALLFGAIILALYLGVTRVWIPISEDSPLPPGVDVRDPALDTSLLQSIGALRVERINPRSKTFNVENRFTLPIQEGQ